jgi:AcrR family transcriptional regulator
VPAPSASARRARRSDRHGELVEAAAAVFVVKGVAATSVDDIVREAGLAKGTFYLYFATKDDVVTAVAAQVVERVAGRIEAVAGDERRDPVQRLLAFGAEIRAVPGEPYERDLIEIFHRPENRALHDRVGEQALSRLAPAVTAIIRDGIAHGHFRDQDAERAGVYVMACFGALHEVVSDAGDLPDAIAELDAFVLRALGHEGPVPR